MIWLCKEILFAMTDPKYYFMTLLCHTVIVSNQCKDNHDFEIDYRRFYRISDLLVLVSLISNLTIVLKVTAMISESYCDDYELHGYQQKYLQQYNVTSTQRDVTVLPLDTAFSCEAPRSPAHAVRVATVVATTEAASAVPVRVLTHQLVTVWIALRPPLARDVIGCIRQATTIFAPVT